MWSSGVPVEDSAQTADSLVLVLGLRQKFINESSLQKIETVSKFQCLLQPLSCENTTYALVVTPYL